MAEPIISADVQHWLRTISQYDSEFKDWERRVKKVIDRYLDRKSVQRKAAKFNILWSNVQTLVPACFSRVPKASVSRRFKDNDPVGRVAAMLLERALQFEIEHYGDFKQAMKTCVQDRFLGGRATTWIRYEPHTATEPGQPDDGLEITEDADEAPNEVLEYECAPVDYVHWRDFGHTVSRTWEEVTAVWRKVYMGRQALIERFGEEVGSKIPLDTKPEDLKRLGNLDGPQDDALAMIYEIWDKASGQAVWLSRSLGEFVDRQPDPLGLQGFWPCPKPLYGTLTSDSLVPVPDLVFYQDQADSCDVLAERISGLVNALKVRGVYDASVPELSRLMSEGSNNDLIPVKNWSAFTEKQGLKGAIDLVDLTPFANALSVCYEAFKEQISQVYQLTGIADIIRGDTDPNETLGAQQIKGQFATLRIRDSQAAVSEFATEILRIKAQLICSKFTPQTIVQIGAADQFGPADQQLVPQALALLKSANERTFRIEVEADSLVQLDENMEKQQRVEFLGAIGSYVEKASQLLQMSPESAPLLVQLLKFGVTAFKVGKSIEGDIDQALDQLREQAKVPRQPPPDPEMVKAQGQMQLEQAKIQGAGQLKQMELQYTDQQQQREVQRDMQLEQWKQQMQAAEVQRQNEIEAQREGLQAQHTAMLKEQELRHAGQLAQLQDEFNRWKTIQDNETKIVVAQIGAAAKAVAPGETPAEDTSEPQVDLIDTIKQALAEAFSSRPDYEVVRGLDGRAMGLKVSRMQ